MTKEYADGYLKGYEDGLREALEELLSNTCRRSYNATEIQLLAKNQRNAIPKKLSQRRKQIQRELGVDLDEKVGEEPVRARRPGRERPCF